MTPKKGANPDHVRFAEKASPHSWYQVMESLDEQARALYDFACGHSIVIQQSGTGAVIGAVDSAHKAVFLLAGFALENAIKAFLVYENPSWICNGVLSRNLRSHELVRLQQLSQLVPYKNRRNRVLRAFEDGLESWARYPCSLTAEDTRDESLLPLELWLEYRRLLNSYDRKLRLLLARHWTGPYGVGGRYLMEGQPVQRVPTYDEVYRSWPKYRQTSEDRLKHVRRNLAA